MSDDLKIGGMHGELGLDVRGWFDGFEDAREVLAELGYAPADIDALAARKVVA